MVRHVVWNVWVGEMTYGFSNTDPWRDVAFFVMSRLREMKLYLLMHIESFPYNHYTLAYLRYAIIRHVHFVQFHMIAKPCKLFKNHSDNRPSSKT